MSMRLRDVRLILEQELPHLTPQFRTYGGSAEFTNRTDVRQSLSRLVKVPSLDEVTSKILAEPVFSAQSLMVDGETQVRLQTSLQRLSDQGRAVLSFLFAQLPDAPGGYVTVHLPSEDNDPSKLGKRFESLFLAFERPVQLVFGAPLKVTLVEPGSVLVELGVAIGVIAGVPKVLSFVGTLLTLGSEKARLKQEQAKAEQEVAKIKQEQAKVEQEDLKTKLLATQLRQEELNVRKAELELELVQMKVAKEASDATQELSEPHEVSALIVKAVDEVAELYESKVTFELQSYADPEIQVNFPLDALPLSTNGSREIDMGIKGLLTE